MTGLLYEPVYSVKTEQAHLKETHGFMSHPSYPSPQEAEALLAEAVTHNPGPWETHSRYVAQAASQIAAACQDLNPEKAYVLGLLHDIGRRFGITHMAHVYDGYHYLLDKGYADAARIALTHSFNLGKLDDYIGKVDVTIEQQEELQTLLAQTNFDEYDYLIQLCDSLAKAEGIVTLEARMGDVKRRYGMYPQEKWDRNLELRRYFEAKMGRDLYEVLQMEA